MKVDEKEFEYEDIDWSDELQVACYQIGFEKGKDTSLEEDKLK